LKTIGHHTCNNIGGEEKILEQSPFLSEKDRFGNAPFLGFGYYYWDNNIDQAHIWGKTRCKNNYVIVKSELTLEGRDFLDLVGNRADMIEFVALHAKLSAEHNNGKQWPLGKFIEFLRKLNTTKYKGIFPWKVSRAVDLKSVSSIKPSAFNFVYKKDNYTDLNPCIVICLYEKNDVILQSKILINQN